MKVLNTHRGSAMLITLMITFLLLILGTSVLFALNSETLMVKQAELQAEATYLAQAGIEHGFYLIESVEGGEEPVFPVGAVRVSTVGNKIYEYDITKNGSEIVSQGIIRENGDIKKVVSIKARWDESGQVTIIK